MTFSFHPEAIAEYREAALWYEKEKPGLGDQFTNAEEAGVGAILENPRVTARLSRESDGMP